jgi:hypothetical protein
LSEVISSASLFKDAKNSLSVGERRLPREQSPPGFPHGNDFYRQGKGRSSQALASMVMSYRVDAQSMAVPPSFLLELDSWHVS